MNKKAVLTVKILLLCLCGLSQQSPRGPSDFDLVFQGEFTELHSLGGDQSKEKIVSFFLIQKFNYFTYQLILWYYGEIFEFWPDPQLSGYPVLRYDLKGNLLVIM